MSAVTAAAASTCAWCEAPFDVADVRLAGRTRCSRCGVATTSPWPSDDDLDRAYGAWYRPVDGRFAGIGDAVLRHTRSSLARRVDRLAPPGRVLDVGAGDGTLVRALCKRGRHAIGVDPFGTGSDVRRDNFLDVTGRWAAIVFWHSLEHLRRPVAALRHAARLLDTDGLLIVAMPNAASMQAAAFGDRWLALDLPRHLVHAPASSLVTTLGTLGLRVTRVSHLRGGQVAFGWAHGMVGALPGHPDLYDAIRSPQARAHPMSRPRRATTLVAGTLALLPALVGAGTEAMSRRGGSVYVEARRR